MAGFPGFALTGSAALVADMLSAHLNKADAMLVADAPAQYALHVERALARFDELAVAMNELRAAQKVSS